MTQYWGSANAAASRLGAGTILLSLMSGASFLGSPARGRMTAAATTGPASGAQPTSSTPQTTQAASFSNFKLGRRVLFRRLATSVSTALSLVCRHSLRVHVETLIIAPGAGSTALSSSRGPRLL